MRIITGTARGCKLQTPAGEEVTRPTTERVKEAVFSMLQFELEGRQILDLFAGSGQMGLEALSRGAAHCFFVDSDSKAIACIKENIAKTKMSHCSQVIYSDSKAWLRRAAGRMRFDICFLDPPYHLGILPEMLELLVRGHYLAPHAIVVCESENESAPTAPAELELQKHVRYGRVFISIFKMRGDPA